MKISEPVLFRTTNHQNRPFFCVQEIKYEFKGIFQNKVLTYVVTLLQYYK